MTVGERLGSVSVIVPTYNRRDRLVRFLSALDRLAPNFPPFEVVVVVDGSTDGTHQALASLRPTYALRVLTQPNAGPAAARNRAIAAAEGDLLVFLDDDVIPTEGLLEQHRAVHRRHPDAVVIGAMAPPPDIRLAPWLRWEADTLRRQYDLMNAGVFTPTWRQFYTANASVRRSHVLAVGGFDEAFRRAEDIELARRLSARGLGFHFAPAAVVLHEPDRTFDGWARVAAEYGRYAVRAGREDLRLAYDELRTRRLLNQIAPRICAGHPRRTAFISGLSRTALSFPGPGPIARLHRAVCSGVYSVQYWHAVAEALGVGPGVWRYLHRQVGAEPVASASRP